MDQPRSSLQIAAVAVAAAALIYAVVSSVSGQIWVVETMGGSTDRVRQFNPASLIPVVGAAGALYFAWKGDSRSVWVIAVTLLVISGLFVFSLILMFAPTALAVTAAAVLLTTAHRRDESGSRNQPSD